jgi:hypothetical protein
MKTTRETINPTENYRPFIWFGIIGAFLTIINNMVAIAALGVAQGPIVAFTTPFAFCLGKLRYPKLPAATLIYLPVVIVSIFTVNFGPPGPYKVTFMIGAVLYDFVCYILRVGSSDRDQVALWKLIIAVLFYPIGLLLGALWAISWVTVELPILSGAWIGAVILMALFGIIGGFATWVSHRVYYRWLSDEEF